MTIRGAAKVIAWLVLAVCIIAGALDFLALAVATGGPHYEGSGLSQAEIASRTHDYQLAVLLFKALPVAFFADLIALWLLYKRLKAA